MREIPAKVFFATCLETGIFVGLGIMLFHTYRVIITANRNHSWTGFKAL